MLIPRPETMQPGEGEFVLDDATVIHAEPDLSAVARWAQAVLRPATGLPLTMDPDTDARVGIVLSLDGSLPAESFRLTVDPDLVRISGGDPAGVFYALQAVRQLLPPTVFRQAPTTAQRWALPAVDIGDSPRFGWRGVMVDVARHFLPKHDLLRFIDLMSMHRLNVLHLHLTDDQGWRIQIRRYPRLTTVGGWRRESQLGAAPDAPGDGRPHGGFYTQDDLREIVGHAAARFITVVPEIDLPGHSQAAIAAYPELGVGGVQREVLTRWGVNPHVLNTEDATVDFFGHVLDEVMELFPGAVIGLGGDECPQEEWQADGRSQQLMTERGLADEDELQAWFIGRLAARLASRGRRMFGWDEILDGSVPPDAIVASWRGLTGATRAARRGLDVVSCPDDQVYLDYRQSEDPSEPIPVAIPLTLADVYRFEPVPEGLTVAQARHVLGGQANIWTEYIDSPRSVDYFTFPRLCAIADVLWSTRPRDYAEFLVRLETHLQRLDAIGVQYRAATGPHPWQTRPGIPGRPSERQP